jgi:hypothetical protein
MRRKFYNSSINHAVNFDFSVTSIDLKTDFNSVFADSNINYFIFNKLSSESIQNFLDPLDINQSYLCIPEY